MKLLTTLAIVSAFHFAPAVSAQNVDIDAINAELYELTHRRRMMFGEDSGYSELGLIEPCMVEIRSVHFKQQDILKSTKSENKISWEARWQFRAEQIPHPDFFVAGAESFDGRHDVHLIYDVNTYKAYPNSDKFMKISKYDRIDLHYLFVLLPRWRAERGSEPQLAEEQDPQEFCSGLDKSGPVNDMRFDGKICHMEAKVDAMDAEPIWIAEGGFERFKDLIRKIKSSCASNLS